MGSITDQAQRAFGGQTQGTREGEGCWERGSGEGARQRQDPQAPQQLHREQQQQVEWDPGPVPAPAAVLDPVRARLAGPALPLVLAALGHPVPLVHLVLLGPLGLPARAAVDMITDAVHGQSPNHKKRTDEKERKRRSPSPKPTKLHLGRLTRNVTKEHIQEIFSTYGKIKMIDMPPDRLHPNLSKGYAYVEYESPEDAQKALKHMDGGQIDGQEITATAVLAQRIRPAPRRPSPPRRMPPPPPMWRRTPPRMRRREDRLPAFYVSYQVSVSAAPLAGEKTFPLQVSGSQATSFPLQFQLVPLTRPAQILDGNDT
ncbi:RNA-binding protein with serine-rich domain 1 [Labeo rohita]|uniref:RNA-binding protein with serine-rich domain 1 n=1 Tax=Labeo rohita TaxID=84645 RepID=A0ABQ8LAT4_LABRO|nr:RNA-binding protein with serine-rich domain 1 [Labeo rohita]